MNNVIIEIRQLYKSYGVKKVLCGIDLSVYEGECLGIIGKNGAGKTTLLECIENIRKWDNGIITIGGVDNSAASRTGLNNILGVQLQSSSLPNDIKVIEAVQLFAIEHDVKYDNSIFDKFGLRDVLNKRYKQLSTGQKRRVHLLLAVLHDPKIIILDEPTAGLDIEGKAQLYKVIQELKEAGKTILLTSHDMIEVEKICDRVAFVIDGKILKVQNLNAENETSKAANILIKINNVLPDYLDDISSGKLIRNENGYNEFICSDLTSFIKELSDEVFKHNDEILDIFVKKTSIEDELSEYIKRGGADESITY